MSALTIIIIFVLLAIWVAVIISRICMCIEKCASMKAAGKYLDTKYNFNDVASAFSKLGDAINSGANKKKKENHGQ